MHLEGVNCKHLLKVMSFRLRTYILWILVLNVFPIQGVVMTIQVMEMIQYAFYRPKKLLHITIKTHCSRA